MRRVNFADSVLAISLVLLMPAAADSIPEIVKRKSPKRGHRLRSPVEFDPSNSSSMIEDKRKRLSFASMADLWFSKGSAKRTSNSNLLIASSLSLALLRCPALRRKMSTTKPSERLAKAELGAGD
jgi:hypothetical protein